MQKRSCLLDKAFAPTSFWGLTCGIAALFMNVAMCETVNTVNASHTIVTERRVLLDTVDGGASIIARTADGGLVVGGGTLAAWLVRTDSNGRILWTYNDAKKSTGPTDKVRPHISGVTQLPNGNILACGGISTTPKTEALLVVIDPQGNLIRRQLGFSKDPQPLRNTDFTHCLPWNGGIVLIGASYDGALGSPRIAKLNGQGDTEWEKSIPGLPAQDVVETPEHDLVGSAFYVSRFEMELAKVSPTGEIVARKSLKGGHSGFRLYPATSMGATKVGIYTDYTDFTLHTFDSQFNETGKPLNIGSFDVQQGRALVLEDEALALFGRDAQPAVAWISPTGTPLALQRFPVTGAYSIPDAVQVSDRKFVFIQDSPNPRGVLMTWASFK